MYFKDSLQKQNKKKKTKLPFWGRVNDVGVTDGSEVVSTINSPRVCVLKLLETSQSSLLDTLDTLDKFFCDFCLGFFIVFISGHDS